MVSVKVGVLRRGRYMKGKKIGKGNVAEEVSLSLLTIATYLAGPYTHVSGSN